MSAAQEIRAAIARVHALRAECSCLPALNGALRAIKEVQSRRFAGSYADLLRSEQYADAASFFLDELYGVRDYTERDNQFARVAGGLERLFPDAVVQTAVRIAGLHSLTEELDMAMARRWLLDTGGSEAARYARAWASVGRPADRRAQLATVLAVGNDMQSLTRKRGLRPLLHLMRTPAAAAGLSALQQFLEIGFDTFAAMTRRSGGASQFLATIAEREEALMILLDAGDPVASETALLPLLGQVR